MYGKVGYAAQSGNLSQYFILISSDIIKIYVEMNVSLNLVRAFKLTIVKTRVSNNPPKKDLFSVVDGGCPLSHQKWPVAGRLGG